MTAAGRPNDLYALGIADEAEVAAVYAAVRAGLEHPDTVVMPHLSFLAWGRKPHP